MENQKIADLQSQVNQLQSELQHQKGMIWIIGEIIKKATNVSSFQDLMKIVTDMLMGVMGVSACYLWVYNEDSNYTLHLRSIFLRNKYLETTIDNIPQFLRDKTDSKPFLDLDIRTPLIQGTPLPSSRLAAPLYDYQRQSPIGFLIVEHESNNFFKESTCELFETLAILIGSNSLNSKLFETVTMETEKDPLTNVYNRKFLSRFLSEPYRSSEPLSLCIFDIDSFKHVNDMYGHEKGDEVLISVADAASSIIDPLGGKVIRYGGDEFILLLNMKLYDAKPILHRLRLWVPSLPVMETFASPITITMGASEYPGSTDDVQDLLTLADSALLRGKALGKNVLELS